MRAYKRTCYDYLTDARRLTKAGETELANMRPPRWRSPKNIRNTVGSYFRPINFTGILQTRCAGETLLGKHVRRFLRPHRTLTQVYLRTVHKLWVACVDAHVLSRSLADVLCANLILHFYNFLFGAASKSRRRCDCARNANHRVGVYEAICETWNLFLWRQFSDLRTDDDGSA